MIQMIKHIAICAIKSLAVFLIGIPVTVIGLPIVAIALLFREEHQDTEQQFTDPRYASQGNHMLVTLPAWALLWDNKFDGAWGDKRGWWNNYCLENYGKDCRAFRSMWQWMAIRNPANYWSRVLTGLDVSQCTITKLAGDDEVDEEPGKWQWQFLLATRDDGALFHRLFCVFPWWFCPTHSVMIDIGWKFKLTHNNMSPDDDVKDRVRGSVFALSPWKSL